MALIRLIHKSHNRREKRVKIKLGRIDAHLF